VPFKAPVGEFFTPDFYRSFATTPGYILPPKWYLMLPAWLRADLLERMLLGQTLAQLLMTLVIALVFLLLTVLVLSLLFRTYHQKVRRQDAEGMLLRGRRVDLAWTRVFLVGLIPPLAWFSEVLIDDYVNITGGMLIATKFFFYSISYLGLGLLAFLAFEAVGRSVSRWIVVLLGHPSDLQLRRVSNLIMPLCRVFGALVAIITFYRLLALLGLPPQTVLAFSAVPGLAIGLGASKLLGNLFAGLSIQTDRPLKVGEFCQIGEHEGFISKIGLRSLELNTIESRITIPNSLVDEQKVINYSVRGGDPAEPSLQGLDLRVVIDQPIVPFQIRELFRLVNQAMEESPDLNLPLASFDPSVDEGLILTCHAQVEASDWPRYLEARQRFILRLRQILSQVSQCYFSFGVSFDTSSETLRAIPEIVAQIFRAEPLARLSGCRFLRINEFSLDFYVEYSSDQPTLALFEDAHSRLLCALIETLRARGIEIPIPTTVEIEKVELSASPPPSP
jgi:MscS family membrane protein